MERKYRIALFGATGLVGSHILSLLSDDDRVEHIDVIARNSHSLRKKATFHQNNLESIEELTTILKKGNPNVALCALGTTMARAKTKEAFYHVDHDLILNVATACKFAGIASFGLISSVGADLKSSFYYPRVKAQTERDVADLNFNKLVILRPAVLLGEREESRPLEKLFVKTAPIFSLLFMGSLKRYRPVDAKDVAMCLIEESFKPEAGSVIMNNELIV